ncbi:MAG: aspartate carbamoyltransferase, partial [Coriobacteriales bacterium]|nr:aspartate carbamoyltransferase [Coriobacteriales bacterium]
ALNVGDVKGKKVAIVGDILHSRVFGSLSASLNTLGAKVIAVAPNTLLPLDMSQFNVEIHSNLDDVLEDIDVIYMLRMQLERIDNNPFPSIREYSKMYGLNESRAARLKDDALIMHPGPMNRGVEMCIDTSSNSKFVVLDQVNAGVAIREAVMYLLLGGQERENLD